jgi:dolichyl-diphosphooligosaccharide---protein glycosyltransferase
MSDNKSDGAPSSTTSTPASAPAPVVAAATYKSRIESIALFFSRSDATMQFVIMMLIWILAFMVRLFSVIRYESIIHEFDPWFNFRVTKYLVKEGFYEFHNWFDEQTWYPLGRYIGGTLYPGLMWTAASLHNFLHLLNLPVDIRNVCVLLAPFMAGNTTIAVYLLAKETANSAAGIMAAAFMAIAPGYISRSVAGSYDNEAVAIFALVITFYLWVKAVNTGSIFWSAMSAVGYFYMVASWGGYIFIINLIPFHVIGLIASGRFSGRLYVAYSIFYTLGTLLSMTISFVSFIPVTSPEHLGSIGVFGLIQLVALFYYLQSMVSRENMKYLIMSFFTLLGAMFVVVIVLSVLGYVPRLTGRLLSLLGASKNIAIVKSVSEHQPSAWTTFFFDFNCLTIYSAVGIWYSFRKLSDASIFMILYILFASYFASIMVRLVLVLSPAFAVMSGIGVSSTLHTLCTSAVHGYSCTEADDDKDDRVMDTIMSAITGQKVEKAAKKSAPPVSIAGAKKIKKAATKTSSTTSTKTAPKLANETPEARVTRAVLPNMLVIGMIIMFYLYVIHCTWVTSNAYSSPSIVLQARQHDGSVMVFDDFREAYRWLAQNTADDAKIMSWWDYGYQITGMGNRTVIVDNNTRNNTHIATVGLAMASTEEDAWPVLRMLDVDYVLVVFGGRIGYSSDDINKFLWMVRISSGTFPRIVEQDYFSKRGQYRVDSDASDIMKNSLMYKMCYYRFGETYTEGGQPPGYDRTRGAVIGDRDVRFKYLEEAFTTEHWMVRIYRVKKEIERIGGLKFPKLRRSKYSGKKRKRHHLTNQ